MNELEDKFNYVTLKTADEVERKIPETKLIGVGGSADNDDIVIFEKLVFNHRGKIDEKKGFLLISEVVNFYLKNIHAENAMKDYLKEHPFTHRNLQVVFIVYDENGGDVFHPDFCFVSLRAGVVSYETLTISENGFYHVNTEKKEPYEQTAKELGVWE